MKKDELASISVKKILVISLMFVFALGIVVFAGNVKLKNVTIKFSNNYEITVLTSKTKISDILEENHITINENEFVTPDMEEEITDTNIIKISLIGQEEVKVSEVIEDINQVTIDNIVETYANITEKIIIITEEIPFETITKDVSNGDGSTVNKVIQAGKNGIREVTYKVKYQNDVEIERIELSSEIIREPINKIVQVQTKTSRSSDSRLASSSSGKSGRYKVTAYCSCISCCGKTNGVTASGVKATANHTIAAPGTFAFGTQVVINGVTYTVEDRGGAIQGNRIDIYMNSHSEALAWGVRYLDVEVLN